MVSVRAISLAQPSRQQSGAWPDRAKAGPRQWHPPTPPPEHVPTQYAGQEAARVVAAAAVRQYRTGQLGRAERIINLPERQQISIGGDGGTVDLQHETTVEIEPRRVGFLLIRWVRHDGPRTYDVSC